MSAAACIAASVDAYTAAVSGLDDELPAPLGGGHDRPMPPVAGG
jgi:hypothetical protein